jgi:hypothetical protein
MATGEASGFAITEQIHGWDARISWRVKKPESGELRRKTQVKDALDGKAGKVGQIARQNQAVALDQARGASAQNAQADDNTIVTLKAGGDGCGHRNDRAHGDVEATAYKLRLII